MELGVCSYCKVPFESFSEIYTSQPGNVKKHKHCGPTYPVAKFPETVLRSEVDIQVAAERDRCISIAQNMKDVYAGHTDDDQITVGNLRRVCDQIIREIKGWS